MSHIFTTNGQLPCRSYSLFGWDTLIDLLVDRLSYLDCNYKLDGMFTVVSYTSLLHHSNHDLYFFRGVYDFGPKWHKRTFNDILLNPVPGIEFDERLDETDDFDASQCRRFNHNNVAR
jgi:hypothetical protein